MTYGFLAMRCNQAPLPVPSLVWLNGSNFQTSANVENGQTAIVDMLDWKGEGGAEKGGMGSGGVILGKQVLLG